MPLWGGIDEAGYGPRLGPLVVAGSAFRLPEPAGEGGLWATLQDAICRARRGSGGRLVINDSKQVYSPSQGLRLLEEGVLAFLQASIGRRVESGGDLLASLGAKTYPAESAGAYWRDVANVTLPHESNLSALQSKEAQLREALANAHVHPVALKATVVQPSEFNHVVSKTGNKSLLLFQHTGRILQDFWRHTGGGESHIVVDKHGGRNRYRRLLKDVFPHCACDVVAEGPACSTYRIADDDRTLLVSFREGGDAHAMPTALASMIAKYVREIHMRAFNCFWQQRVPGLKATAGYGRDAGRFLREIAPVLMSDGIDSNDVVRLR
jgi:ribonuclease HII